MVSKKQIEKQQQDQEKQQQTGNNNNLSQVISVYISGNKIALIDRVRGGIPRSTWVKSLIDKEITKYDGG